nr:MAG TPA: hypothetical protein [Caudoviricetes sp.]
MRIVTWKARRRTTDIVENTEIDISFDTETLVSEK